MAVPESVSVDLFKLHYLPTRSGVQEVGVVEQVGVLGSTGAALDVVAVVTEDEQGAPRYDRSLSASEDACHVGARQVQVEHDDEFEACVSKVGCGGVRYLQCEGHAFTVGAGFGLAEGDGEKSRAVTCQPARASHRAIRPSPAATSSARPGVSPESA